jgi:hypothetical protein
VFLDRKVRCRSPSFFPPYRDRVCHIYFGMRELIQSVTKDSHDLGAITIWRSARCCRELLALDQCSEVKGCHPQLEDAQLACSALEFPSVIGLSFWQITFLL